MRLDIPTDNQSAAALEWIGFTPETAMALQVAYSHIRSPLMSLIDYAISCVHLDYYLSPDCITPFLRASRDKRLEVIGISPQLRKAILDSEFQDVCDTQTDHFWAVDSLKTNYRALEEISLRLKNYTKAHGSSPNSPKNEQTQLSQPGSLSPEDLGDPLPEIESSLADYGLRPQVCSVVDTARQDLPNHITLWMARAVFAADSVGEHYQLFTENGSVIPDELGSKMAGYDFGVEGKRLLVLYGERDTAEKFRQWTARRCPAVETLLVKVQLPTAFINGQRQENIYPSAEFKEYVWYSRNPHILEEDRRTGRVDRFQRFLEAGLIQGPICRAAHLTQIQVKGTQIQGVAREDVETALIAEDFMEASDDHLATQWVFINQSSTPETREDFPAKLHIEIFPPSDSWKR
ncbi:hypothetical protein B0O99DRAFT_619128 [Bisporella sp. PMI_857]|nr:hypothetical protein B0O99DRAFT_619128 [Bisporella sp. PMI_857]